MTGPPTSSSPPSEARSTCPYCGVGCGLIASTHHGRLLDVRGDEDAPVNRGATCRKPIELPSATHHRTRALVPKRRAFRGGPSTAAPWDEVTAEIATRLLRIRDEHGPQAIGFYISGQLLTEDYYAVNKLAKGLIGTNTVDSNSRLCMSSAVAGYRQTFGYDGPPASYEDFASADVMLLLGTNTAACHPIVWGRIQQRIAEGGEVIVCDPRRTATAREAALHLPVRPGGDLPLLLGMLHVIDRDGMVDREFADAHLDNVEQLLAVAARWSPARAAAESGVAAEAIEDAAHRFGTASRAMALWSMGANQSTQGTRINRMLHALCLLTGNIGRPGTGPLSLTGQPNAMGGREVGGLSDLLPGYRTIKDAADRRAVQDFWNLPDGLAGGISELPGKPASDIWPALQSGEMKAIWIVATNPLVSFPDAGRLGRALEAAELVVVQDAYDPTESTAFADFVLPAAQWPEKEGTMTNSERRVQRVRATVPPPGEAKADWEIFAAVGRAMGAAKQFAWTDAAAVHGEYVQLTAGRPCDQSGLSHARLDREGSLQWPVPATPAGTPGHPGTPRLYEDLRFPTESGRAQLVVPEVDGPAELADGDYPLLLTTGRLPGHWHTLSRTGRSPALRGADPEPLLEVHPGDLGDVAGDGELVRVRSRRGWVTLRVKVTDTIRPGTVFAPFHWGELFAAAGRRGVNAVTIDATDPDSRQPELKTCAVRLEPARRRPQPSVTHPTRLVIAGGGPAALAVIEEALTQRPASDWTITMVCAEPQPPYDRIALSRALSPDGPTELALRHAEWYHERGVRLVLGRRAEVIDTAQRQLLCEDGERIPYDKLVIATGSRVATPPILGLDLDGVVRLRTKQDSAEIRARAERGDTIVVVGGGLVGLEAAAALAEHGAHVSVVHGGRELMDRQLDSGSARWLRRRLEERGIRCHVGHFCQELIEHQGRVVGVKLASGDVVPGNVVVIATGVSPVITVAARSGLKTERGVVVDDTLRTSAPNVWAIGECAEHDGTVYGTWAPIAEQARVAAADIAGKPAGFRGRPQPTKLKVPGIDLFSCGNATGTIGDPDLDEVVSIDSRAGTYRRLVFDGRQLVGAVLMGDVTLAGALTDLLQDGGALPDAVLDAIVAGTAPDPRQEQVCSCKNVSGAQIADAVAGGAGSVEAIAACTGASTGCGSCKGRVAQLVEEFGAAPAPDEPVGAPAGG